MWIYFLIVLIIGLCILDYVRNRNVLSPGFAFNIVWLVTLILYQFKLSYIQHDLSMDTIFIFSLCASCYNISVVLTRLLFNNKTKDKTIVKHKITTDNKLKIASAITIIIFIIETVYSKGTPLIWKIFYINKTYFDFGIPSLNGFLYCLLMVLGAYAIFKKSKTAIIYFLLGLLALSRQVILSMIIEAFICFWLTRPKKVNYFKVAIAILGLIVGFSVIGNFRSGSNTMNYVFKAKKKYEKMPTIIKWTYSYMTFSLSNFNNLVSKTDGFENYGVSSIKEFMPTVILNKFKIKENVYYDYLISPNYTVSTYLPSVYLDFGMLGVAIFNIFLGVLGGILYRRMKDNKNDRNLLLYSVFIHNILFLFFSNMFLNISVSFQFILILILFNNDKTKIGG